MSLKVWLPLDGNLHNLGCSNITATATNATINNTGKIGSCYSFNGSSSYIKLDKAPFDNTTKEFSYCCWFKPNNQHAGCLFSNRNAVNDTGITIFYYSSTMLFDVGGRWQFTPSTAITVNAWNHLVFTYKTGEGRKMYLNGVLTNSDSTNSTQTTANSTSAFIGMSLNSSTSVNANPLNGYLNDIRIYNHCLSAAEVHEISLGLVLHYKLNDITNNILDSSGYGHNGTILNTITLSSDTPRYSASINLTAGNSMINCGRGAMVTDSLTVNLWIKYSTWGNPISCTEGGGWNFENSSGIQFPVYIASVGYKVANAGTLPSANTWHMITGTYDRLGLTVNIYIDGELKKSTATGSANLIGYHGSNVIWIGAEATGSNTTASNGMIGLVSDARIYCTALSAADIKLLYEVGAKVDNLGNWHTFEFKETNGIAKIKKTGITEANEVYDNMNFNNRAQIVKNNTKVLITGDLNIITTYSSSVKTGTMPSLPGATVKSLAGKTLRFVYDVCAPGARYSTELGQTAWSYTRYGIHGGCSLDGSANYPFAGQLNYSGNSFHAIQTWTIPTGKSTYGDLGFSIQNFDKPASTNNATWFIRNVRLELVDGTSENITGTQLIER